MAVAARSGESQAAQRLLRLPSLSPGRAGGWVTPRIRVRRHPPLTPPCTQGGGFIATSRIPPAAPRTIPAGDVACDRVRGCMRDGLRRCLSEHAAHEHREEEHDQNDKDQQNDAHTAAAAGHTAFFEDDLVFALAVFLFAFS